jgi:hypothetical protein
MADALPWKMLGDCAISAIEGTGSVTVWIAAPHIAARLGAKSVRFALGGVEELRYRPLTDQWDEPWIEDAEQISRFEIPLADVIERKRDPGLAISTPSGRLNLRYHTLAIETEHGAVTRDALREAVRGYWAEWRTRAALTGSHPLLRMAMDVLWTPALLADLVTAWREHRTTELADTIAIVDRAIRGAVPARFRDPADADRWIATWSDNPSAALEVLGDRAASTHITPMQAELGGQPSFDEYRAATAKIWAGITRCVGGLLGAPPDPRIGRGLIGVLLGTSDHYFRIDQVAHAVTSFEKPHDDPSFADHLFPLLELHADDGTEAVLVEEARMQSIECDCNGAEMSERLRDLADKLFARYPTSRALAPDAAQALRERGLA